MDQAEMLLKQYSLEDILEMNDITEEYVLTWLIEDGMINLETEEKEDVD